MPIDRAEPGVPASLAFAATYNREVRFGIDRIWENLLDWEHLPALHEIFFDDVALLEIGSWGWRVELTKTPGTAGRRMVVELRIDRANARYCARTLAGDGAGTEIWTLQEALGPQRTAVEVRFYLPERRPDRLAALGEKYRSSHARLWDQDEAMMMRREALSTRGRRRRKASGALLALGPLRELRRGCRSASRSTESRSAYSRSRMERLSPTARFARTGSDRSRTSCRRMASCVVLGTAICSMSGPA